MTAYPRPSTVPQAKKGSPLKGLSPCIHSRLAALGPAVGAAAKRRRAVAGCGLWTMEITVPRQSSYTTSGDASLTGLAYDVFVDTGIMIQPVPVASLDWADPDSFARPSFLRNVAREGIQL
jgi:hypothetical protein